MTLMNTIDNQPYIVGNYYQVPTVYGMLFDTMNHWPVMLPMHEDAEIIGFPYKHYHIDWRFVPTAFFKRQYVGGSWRSVFGIVLHSSPQKNEDGFPEPVMRRLKCKREFDAYPHHLAKWKQELESKYQDCILKTPVCPHQGVRLDNLPCNKEGHVTCPAHGLVWNINTGELVKWK